MDRKILGLVVEENIVERLPTVSVINALLHLGCIYRSFKETRCVTESRVKLYLAELSRLHYSSSELQKHRTASSG
jgi:hypothetical protein